MHTFNANQAQRAEIAAIFGVHASTVSRWKKAGAPANADGTYSAPAVHRWLMDQAIRDLGAASEPSSEACSNSQALESWRQERFKIARIERQKLEETLIEADQVHRQWADRVVELASGLECLAERFAAILPEKDADTIRKIVSDEVWHLRDQYARHGRYCPPLNGDPWSEGENPE